MKYKRYIEWWNGLELSSIIKIGPTNKGLIRAERVIGKEALQLRLYALILNVHRPQR